MTLPSDMPIGQAVGSVKPIAVGWHIPLPGKES